MDFLLDYEILILKVVYRIELYLLISILNYTLEPDTIDLKLKNFM